MKNFVDKVSKNKIFRFLVVGGCSTFIDFIVYMLLSIRLDINLAKGISMIVSSIFSYFANKNYTFSNKDNTTISYLLRFYLVFGANFGTNLGMNYLIFSKTGYKLLAYVVATACGMMVNYLGQKFIVFECKHT